MDNSGKVKTQEIYQSVTFPYLCAALLLSSWFVAFFVNFGPFAPSGIFFSVCWTCLLKKSNEILGWKGCLLFRNFKFSFVLCCFNWQFADCCFVNRCFHFSVTERKYLSAKLRACKPKLTTPANGHILDMSWAHSFALKNVDQQISRWLPASMTLYFLPEKMLHRHQPHWSASDHFSSSSKRLLDPEKAASAPRIRDCHYSNWHQARHPTSWKSRSGFSSAASLLAQEETIFSHL